MIILLHSSLLSCTISIPNHSYQPTNMLLILSLGKMKKNCLDPLTLPTITPFSPSLTEKFLEGGFHTAISVFLFPLESTPVRLSPYLTQGSTLLKPVEMLAPHLYWLNLTLVTPLCVLGLNPSYLHLCQWQHICQPCDFSFISSY